MLLLKFADSKCCRKYSSLLLSNRFELVTVLLQELFECDDFNITSAAGHDNESEFSIVRLGSDLVGARFTC